MVNDPLLRDECFDSVSRPVLGRAFTHPPRRAACVHTPLRRVQTSLRMRYGNPCIPIKPANKTLADG